MVVKDFSLSSKCEVKICNMHLDGGNKPSLTIKTLKCMVTKVFHHHPFVLNGQEKPFTTIQILKGILKLMRITSDSLLTYTLSDHSEKISPHRIAYTFTSEVAVKLNLSLIFHRVGQCNHSE